MEILEHFILSEQRLDIKDDSPGGQNAKNFAHLNTTSEGCRIIDDNRVVAVFIQVVKCGRNKVIQLQ